MIKDCFLLAFKNVRKRGIRSWLTILGIFLGIAAMVSLISLGTGLHDAIVGQFGALDADKLLVQNAGTGLGPPGSTAVKKLTENDLNLIKSVSDIEFAIPRLIRIVKVDFDKKIEFHNVGSAPNNKEELDVIHDFLNAEISTGKLLTATDRGKVVIGGGIAEINYNKDSSKSSNEKIRVGQQLLIQGESFEVAGILKKNGSFVTNRIILMPEENVRKILKINDEIDMIVVQVNDEKKLQTVAANLERKLRQERKQTLGEEDFSVQTPVQSVSAISTILDVIKIIVSGIAAISLLVGGIGIANTMYASVLERRKEIGVMKSIEAQNKDILSIFLIEAALLGLVGGIIGTLIGLSLAFGVSAIVSSAGSGMNLNITLSIPLLIFAITFSLFMGIISGIVPALNASKLNPVEALRK